MSLLSGSDAGCYNFETVLTGLDTAELTVALAEGADVELVPVAPVRPPSEGVDGTTLDTTGVCGTTEPTVPRVWVTVPVTVPTAWVTVVTRVWTGPGGGGGGLLLPLAWVWVGGGVAGGGVVGSGVVGAGVGDVVCEVGGGGGGVTGSGVIDVGVGAEGVGTAVGLGAGLVTAVETGLGARSATGRDRSRWTASADSGEV